MLRSIFWLAACASVASTFPIASVSPTEAQLMVLNSSTAAQAHKDAVGANVTGAALRVWASNPANMIVVDASDLSIASTFPDTTIDNHCSHKMQALSNDWQASLVHDSYLNGSVSIARGQPPAIFAEAYLDSFLAIQSSVRVSTGAELFGHCEQIARDTTRISVKSHGQSLMAAEIAAENAHIALVDGKWSLVFHLNFTLQAKVVKWDIEEVTASGGCKIKILGITILSVCGWMADEIKKVIQPLIDGVITVSVPPLIDRIQTAVNAKIGDQIVIPLHKKTSSSLMVEQFND